VALYVVGDVQGCMASFSALLSLIDYHPGRDRLWLAGDLVNRGPRSLDVLRWVRDAGDGAVTVLGNHDLHLLARAAGVAEPKKKDTLDEVLAAPDRDELLAWLRSRPLVHRDGGFLLLHAGLLPAWELDDAERSAREVEAVLRGPRGDRLLAERSEIEPRWRDDLPRWERVKLALFALTRLRVCAPDGSVERDFDGPPEDAPGGARPWFELRRPTRETLLFGHWSALGYRRGPGWIGLDSGCVWGQSLTAVRLDDGQVFQQPSVE